MEHKLSITCPNFEIAEVVEQLFHGLGYGTGFSDIDESVVVNVFFKNTPDMQKINARVLTIKEVFGDVFEAVLEQVDDIDWVSKNQQSYEPFLAGNFFIYQSLYMGQVPSDKYAIRVDATRAFGTGSHGTTSGCLDAITKLSTEFDFKNILDVGTGTGILSVACHHAFKNATIRATDIDLEAVLASRETVRVNDIENIVVYQADGLNEDNIIQVAPYDLVIANILCEPLLQMATSIASVQENGGVLILSGMLGEHKKKIIEKYKEFGYSVIQDIQYDDWRTLALIKEK